MNPTFRVSSRLRFRIFKRDNFRCRYCGKRPPDISLELDHVHPVSAGGTSTDENLVTSCHECNRGKSAELLEHPPFEVRTPAEKKACCELDGLTRAQLIAIIFEIRFGMGSAEKDPYRMVRRELHDYVRKLIDSQPAEEEPTSGG